MGRRGRADEVRPALQAGDLPPHDRPEWIQTEEFNVIKTLVSIELDLVSSLAIRFACQLGSLMDAEIHPVYVKESSPHDSVWGAGWASRTWEKEMVQQGKAEIAELITAEMDFCPVLKRTQGDLWRQRS